MGSIKLNFLLSGALLFFGLLEAQNCNFDFEQFLKESIDSEAFNNMDTNYMDSIPYDFNKTNPCLIKFFKTSLLKGKVEKDSLLIAKSYSVLAYLHENDLNIAIAYADSLNNLPLEKINSKRYIFGPYTFGYMYYNHEKPKLALDYYKMSYKRANSIGDIKDKLICLEAISAVYGSYSSPHYSLLIDKKMMELILQSKSELKNLHDLFLHEQYNDFIYDYLRIKNYDSALYYVKKNKKLSKKVKNNREKLNTKTREAETHFYLKNYNYSKSIFDSLLPFQTETHSIINTKYYLGMIAGHQGNYLDKLNTFKEIDSLMETYSGPLYSTHDTYTFLLQDAVKNDRKEEQLTYLNKLIRYDSIEASNALYIQNKEKLNFELDELRKMRAQLNNERHIKNFVIWFGSTIVLVLSLIFALYVKRSKRQRLALEERLKHPITVNLNNRKEEHKTKEDIEQFRPLLEKLEAWEQQMKFTDLQVTLPSLAKELGTNGSYLSKVINQFKGQNFSNYLKDLRITELINFLKENPDFIEDKSIVQIAEHFGFNSKDVFSRTLKQKLGVTPALFFKTIRNRS